MTPAEELRAAAQALRDSHFIVSSPHTATAVLVRAVPALADWLDSYAEQLAASTHPGWQETTAGHPLAVARAILGSQP